MQALQKAFISAATSYGKVIVHMSLHEKHAHSLRGKGVAGGQKFLNPQKTIFFKVTRRSPDSILSTFHSFFQKLARDDRNIYGGDQFAQKAAGHEMRSMVELAKCGIPHLHLPLACIIEYGLLLFRDGNCFEIILEIILLITFFLKIVI